MSWENRNLFNRRFNHSLNTEDAYVSGYFGINYGFSSTVLRDTLSTGEFSTGGFDANFIKEVPNMLSTLTEGVTTLPGGTLNVVDITAMGGAKWGAPTNVDFGDQVTIKFRELSHMPIKKFITAWFNLVRHSNTALSELHTDGGAGSSTYTKRNFACDLIYWTTKPNGRDIEFAMSMQGCYPMSDLSSQIATDLTTVDGQTFDVNFHVDAIYWDSYVEEKAKGFVEALHSSGSTTYYHHQSPAQGG